MNARRIALVGLNGAGGLGLLLSLAGNLSAVPDGEPRAPQMATVPEITGAVSEQAHKPAGRILFEPVPQNAPKAAGSRKPPFRLVGIIARNNESFAVVQIDERTNVRMRLNEEIQGWRLDDLRRTSARFASEKISIDLDLTSPKK